MTLVATVPFCSNTLFAESQTNYPICDMQEQDAWDLRMNKLENAMTSYESDNNIFKLTGFFMSESDQIIVVDLREECDGMPAYLAEGFHGFVDPITGQYAQKDNECFWEALDILHYRIENDEYQISQPNLTTLETMLKGEFKENFDNRYISFQDVDGKLKNELFVDQFLQQTISYSADHQVRFHYLPYKDTTTTVVFLYDQINSAEKLDHKLNNHNISRNVSRLSPSIISTPKSNELYDRLVCDMEVRAGAEWKWGGKEPSSGNGYVRGKVSDNQGNSLQGGLEYGGNGSRGYVDVGVSRQDNRREDRGRD